MKNLIYYFTFALVAVFLLSSFTSEPPNGIEALRQNNLFPTLVFKSGEQKISKKELEGEKLKRTVLGKKRINPFDINKIEAARKGLYKNSTERLQPTDLYVQFTPKTVEEMKELIETDIFFFDFPLEYEVLEMGDYYQELKKDEFPVLYATVKIGYKFPKVAHKIISELYLDKSDPLLIAESFRLTGNKKEIQSYVFPKGSVPPTKLVIDFPDPINCPDGCVARRRIDDSTVPVQWEWYCDCSPSDDDDDGDPSGPVSCVSGHKRTPGGRVTVEDTEFSTHGVISTYKPVRRVKIYMKDTWFTHDVTWTDDNGCWKINKRYYGKAWLWVVFKNDRCKIRGTVSGLESAYQWILPVMHYAGVYHGPRFNNININFHVWSEQGSYRHRNWAAATVNNALHEFYDYASADHIMTPPSNLDIFVGRKHRYGYAFMPHFMGPQLTSYAIGNGISGNSLFISPFGVLLSLFSPVGIVTQFFPDVFVGSNFRNSDRLKRLAFHEIAHSSHYRQVGPFYYAELVAAEIAADGHGTPGSNDAGRIAVCESWADFLGYTYNHRTFPSNGVTSIGRTWREELERTWNETNGHVPIGLHHDLIDVGEPPFSSSDSNTACNEYGSACATINDNVSGFTIAQLFSSLNSSTTTINQYRLNLITHHLSSTTNSVEELNALFNSY